MTVIYKSVGFAAHLTVVEPQSHVLLLDAEPLGQVEVDVLDGAHAAEAARVGQHPLQRGVGWRDAACWSAHNTGTFTNTLTAARLVSAVCSFVLTGISSFGSIQVIED